MREEAEERGRRVIPVLESRVGREVRVTMEREREGGELNMRSENEKKVEQGKGSYDSKESQDWRGGVE